MITADFLETYPLYRKFPMEVSNDSLTLGTPPINMPCTKCGGIRTFRLENNYEIDVRLYKMVNSKHRGVAVWGSVLRAEYKCSACTWVRLFFLQIAPDGKWVKKVGQVPPWEGSMDATLERKLGSRADLYRKGQTCESQGYGIGAFAYYRRIVELVIDDLLQSIRSYIDRNDLEEFDHALDAVHASKDTATKIDAVKELLPASLRPGGKNPLGLLFGAYSGGLHSESDDACLEYSAETRIALEYLVSQLAMHDASATQFEASLQRIADRRASSSNA
jgi:hypothetical protein